MCVSKTSLAIFRILEFHLLRTDVYGYYCCTWCRFPALLLQVDSVDVADPGVIGRNTATVKARVVQKTSLPDRCSVPMATNNANTGLDWGWSGWFP
jgi:hypothetical protein